MNGGVIGRRNVPGVDGFSGVWSLQEIADAQRAGVWLTDGIPPLGLLRRYKADNLALTDGDPVASWTDSSPAADHAVQATLSNQPIFKAGILNGHAVVRFDGSNDYFSFGPVLNSAASVGHIFIVSKQDTTAVRRILGTRPIDNGTDGWSLRYESATQVLYYHAGKTPNIPYSISDKFNVIETKRNQLEVAIGADGVLGTPANISGYTPGEVSGTYIGLSPSATEGYMSGDIAEIIIYDRILANFERDVVLSYAINTYGIVV